MMAFHRMLHVSLYLAVFLSVVYGKPDSFPMPFSNSRPDCQPNTMMACTAPMSAFLGSPEGQQLQQIGRPGMRISDVITESVFRTMCSLAQPIMSCMDDWNRRCLTIPPELMVCQELMSRANTKLLSVCNETDGYSKLSTLVDCGEKIRNQVQSCAETMRAGIMETIGTDIPYSQRGRFTSPMEFVKAQNPQNVACCFVKKFKKCITPGVQSTCTADEKSVTEELGDRILEALECTDTMYQAC